MKVSVTLEGDVSILAVIAAAFSAPGAPAVAVTGSYTGQPPVTPAPSLGGIPPMPANGGGEEDDDTGPVNTAAPAVDASGLPWDERIHAGTRTMTAEGMWKKKKGASGLVESVEAELRANAGVQQPVVPVAQPQVTQPVMMPPMQPPQMQQPLPTPIPPMPATQPVIAQPAPPEMQAAVAGAMAMQPVAQPVNAAPTGPMDFNTFMTHLSSKMSERDANGAPLVHMDYIASIAAQVSQAFIQAGQITTPLTAITDIAANPAMIDYAVQLLQRDGRW